MDEPELRRLRLEVDSLTRRVDDGPDHGELNRRHKELSGAVAELRAVVETRLDGVESAAVREAAALRREMSGVVAALQRRLGALERRMRALAGDAVATLDPTPAQVALAQRAERGRRCAAELLAPERRTAQTDLAAAWTTWQAAHRARAEEAVDASRVIAETRPGDERRAAAEETYRAARAALGTLAERRDATERAAAQAEGLLARDITLRDRYAAEIDDGEQAWAQLTAQLGETLAAAVQRDAVLPAWFDDGLAPAPESGRDEWLHAGVDLLAYRATYGVTDAQRALGPPPDAAEPALRREWYHRLAEALARHR